jgi:hypothetical protein
MHHNIRGKNMNQTFTQNLSKSKEMKFTRKIEVLLESLDENVRAIKEINKDNDKLKKSNERVFKKLRKSLDEISTY